MSRQSEVDALKLHHPILSQVQVTLGQLKAEEEGRVWIRVVAGQVVDLSGLGKFVHREDPCSVLLRHPGAGAVRVQEVSKYQREAVHRDTVDRA